MVLTADDKITYRGSTLIKSDGVVTQFTKTQVTEYARCMQDPVYFIEKYMKIINLDDGLVPFNMHEYQREMVNHFASNRFSICLASRQIGKSTVVAAYLLWEALFHSDLTIVLLANKGDAAREILSRIILALENVPFFLQPGCKEFNKGSIKFSNNSRIFAASTSSNAVRGKSANIVYLDEFAFVDKAEEFYTSTYPIISSGKTTKVIITSTANGVGNLFHIIWEGAVQGTNEFKPIRIDWFMVPGRDEKWKVEQIRNTSERQFAQEHGNCVGANTVITIRNKQTGEVQQIKIAELYKFLSHKSSLA